MSKYPPSSPSFHTTSCFMANMQIQNNKNEWSRALTTHIQNIRTLKVSKVCE